MAATIILTEARLECLIALATHANLIINKNSDVRWVRYQPDTDENILKVLTKLASDKSVKQCDLYVAIPYVKGIQQADVQSQLQTLASRSVTCTWFGAESAAKGMNDICSQAGVAYHAMPSYAADIVNEAPRTPWKQMSLEQKRNAYVEYRLRHLYMGVGRPGTHLRDILIQLASASSSPSFAYSLPTFSGEKGGVLSKEQTEVLVKRFTEKRYPVIAGRSAQVEEIKRLIRDVAMTDLNVLISGETGTGKEGAAYFIHELSCRRLQPYRELNCAGLDDKFLESTLFGHVKGAYTGADKERPGLVELVSGGTLFLDELPDLSPPVQAKLLRFIQSGEYTPLGSDAVKQSNCRIIAAGQPDRIASDIRLDLYMRLSEAEIILPSLRGLGVDDIITIARNRADSLQGERKVAVAPTGTTSSSQVKQGDVKKFWDQLDETKDLLVAYTWMGNTRELFKLIKQAMLLGQPWRELLDNKIKAQGGRVPVVVDNSDKRSGTVMSTPASTAGCVTFLQPASLTDLLTVDDLQAAYVQHVYACLGKEHSKGRLREKLGIKHNETFNSYLLSKTEREQQKLERQALNAAKRSQAIAGPQADGRAKSRNR